MRSHHYETRNFIVGATRKCMRDHIKQIWQFGRQSEISMTSFSARDVVTAPLCAMTHDL
ncbi:hypothetical protein Plhal304r1_c005g0018991 [Plasmopara halstedii]